MELTPAPTMRTLLTHPELRITLTAPEAGTDAALNHPVRWVHNSDLVDPTPFLSDDLVLLTTGGQLTEQDADGTTAYVNRLVNRGVLALGFGSGVHRVGPSDELVAACAAAHLPLFEVPYDVPFLAIARVHAEAIAAHTYARRTWALEAQRALALAALRPRALESIMGELARRLDCWVGLFDTGGSLVHEHPAAAATHTAVLQTGVAELIGRGAAASRTIGDDEYSVFTIGRTGQLRGALAVAETTLDAEARAVITAVIAMAGLALGQSEQISRARRRLLTQLLESLKSDDPALARRVLGSLPSAPVVVAITDTPRVDAVVAWGERMRAVAGAVSFIAEDADGLTICVGAGTEAMIDQLAEQFGIRIGVAPPADYRDFSRAHAQAKAALRRVADAGVVRYHDVAAGGVLDALISDETRVLAQTRLAPLRARDAETGSDLENTLVVWLENNAHSEKAAASLGIHRHTLRTRIAQASSLLDADLSSFPARAELWAALRAVS